jgi:hypothetical protein
VAGGGPSVFVTAPGDAGVPVVLYQEQLAIATTAYTLQNNYTWVFAANSGKLDANAGVYRVAGGSNNFTALALGVQGPVNVGASATLSYGSKLLS